MTDSQNARELGDRSPNVGGQSPSADYPQVPIAQHIEAHAVQQPDAIALTFQTQNLTYGELNQRANQLAHYLNQRGVGAGVAVAVCVEPSLDIGVSLLGILKAGGVYVPLDPTYPLERLGTILEDTQPQIVLTQSHLLSKLPLSGLPALADQVFCFDRDWETLQSLPVHNPANAICLDQAAYLVYTSGTTGKPKGVMTSHRNLINYILVAQERYGFDCHDVMPAIARFTFSITMFELLTPLVAGGTVMLLEREHILDFQRLVQTLEQITVVHTSPSLMRKLLAYIQAEGIDSQRFQKLRHASCGGDMVPADLLTTMQTVFQQAEIFVIYGCSEISCMGCTYPVARDFPQGRLGQRPVTKSFVGKPFPNVSVRLYDTEQNLVPIGEIGEVWIGGAGVTLGYLNREDLTQERYVAIDGEQFYRTGDLGRWNSDGDLELLGRSDFQIQLRGMRIEPGEIEVTLRQFPGVTEAVVVARELGSGEPGLVAYVVLDLEQPPTIAQMRQWLQVKLPDYMVPAVFVPLAALPLTPNGKIDRRSLPAPDFARLGLDETTYVAPRNPLETLIADIWTIILGVEQVGIHDDFFALGGHSLLATQVVYRLREALNVALPISQLFESPTVAQLATHLSSLCTFPALNAIPKWLDPIIPIQRDALLPLSESQSSLWFLCQMGVGCAYNIPFAVNLAGTLNIAVLAQSVTEIVRRHEPLRTIFPLVNGSPVQHILPAQPFDLAIVDLQSLPEEEQQAEVYRLAQIAAQHPFNLESDLPWHVTLLRLHDAAHVLLVTMHHIVSDGWSLAVFRRELAVLYTAFLQGEMSPLPDLPVQYADFIPWQRKWRQGEWLNQQLEYWKQQLAGAPLLLELPSDRPRPPRQTFNGGTVFFDLDSLLTQRLKALSRSTGSTLFMTLLAAWATLLARYSRQEDLVIGSPIANRPRTDIEPLIGFFINLLPFRVDLSGNPDFLTLLKRVRRVALDAYANQDAPFGQIVTVAQPELNPSYSPLFQVLFVLQNSPEVDLCLPSLTLSSLRVETGAAQYDLTLMVEETPDGLIGEFEYNRDLFDVTTIARMSQQFQTLLQEIVTEPQRQIAQLSLLASDEFQQLLALGQGNSLPYPQDHCIHQLFEAQVERTPDAIALVSETQKLTYQELNQRANQLARHLRALGVGPEELVAIFMERSIDLVVSILGILKAGGAYIPIDPAYATDRQAYQLADAQPRVIITQQVMVVSLFNYPAQVVAIDADEAQISQYSTEDLPPQAAPYNLAYIIYTSGSTGKPKGVMVPHQGVVNHSMAIAQEFGLTTSDRVLQFSSMGFDIFVEEVFPSLTSGATLVLRSGEIALSTRAFRKFIQHHQLTILNIPTAFWHEWVNGLVLLQETVPSSVRLVVVGGEKASQAAYHQWQQLTGKPTGKPIRWLNAYGPTEATVTATIYDPKCSEVDPVLTDIPIGRAIANVQTYILDPFLQPVPIGAPGELHIGGIGLARGYLNLPEKTEERFIANPFQPGERLYKTGDIAYYLPDGNINFIGRMDYQVKIRGFRIELGEIETCLEHHPTVQQAVVLVREDVPGNKSLVAYVTTPNPKTLTPSELSQFLQPKLPHYMVPANFVVLENFPLTTNGKVDRRALPVPMQPMRENAAPFTAPQDELEVQLIHIWETVLGIRAIGVNDDFFELGGHSLLAAQLFDRIEQSLGKPLPPTLIFQAPTVKTMAALLREPTPSTSMHSAIVIQSGDATKPPLFCTHVLGPNCQFFRPLVAYLAPDQPVYGLSAQMDRENAPPNRVEDIATYYIKEMKRIQPQGPYHLTGVSFGGYVAFEMACQLSAQGESVALIALLDTSGPSMFEKLPSLTRVSAHLEGLLKTGPVYMMQKLRSKVKASRNKLLANYSKLLQRTGRPLPYNLKFLMVLEENERAASTYKPKVYPGHVTLFRATEHVFYSQAYLDAGLGWRELAGELEIHDVPGDHMGMLEEPNVMVLGKKFSACIGKATNNISSRQ